jgi:membrane protease subunit HflC
MKRMRVIIAVLILLGVIIVFADAAFIVTETQQVIITEFGEPVGDPITKAGLYFKKPFIQRATYFEKRILEWDGVPSSILTGDKRKIKLNTWARWRIVDPLKFYARLKSEYRALSALDQAIDSAVRNVVTSHELIEAVRDSNRRLSYASEELEQIEAAKGISIKIGRSRIEAQIQDVAQAKLKEGDYGIELIDVQIKRIIYVRDVIGTVYNRMKAERLKIRKRYESEGERQREEIEGEIAEEKARIESEGYLESMRIRGEADAQAIKIYADAYGKDPEFYSFLETLRTYEKTFNKDTQLILSTDSDYFKYLKNYLQED